MLKTFTVAVAVIGALTCVNAASGAASAAPRPPAAPGDWTTYHKDNARSGDATDLAPPSTLSTAWHATLDGAVYGQPLVIGSEILAATENDTVYGLDASSGAVRWKTNVGKPQPRSGLPCGDISPLGITSTMAYDAATGRVFAVAETAGGHHKLVGINASTGAVEVTAGADSPKGTALDEQQRSALTVLDGRVYIAYGGLSGDCGNYIGSVVSLTTAGTGQLSYSIPTKREGGIWSTGGAVVDGGQLFYASATARPPAAPTTAATR